jgi:DNA-binding NarL/FixJ family response regulator
VATPVTVVVVGDDEGWDPAELPGVRLLARAEDPRRAARLVDRARPQVVLAGLGRGRDAVLAVVPELTARVPGARVLAVAARPAPAPGPTAAGDALAPGPADTTPGTGATARTAAPGAEADVRTGSPGTGADVLAAVHAGASGYLVASGDPQALADAVRRTAAGEAVFSPGLAEVVLEARRGPDAGPRASSPTRLTDREVDVLRLVVDGLTARQIATRLVLSPRTVEHHIQRVLRKLSVPNRAALVRHAIENSLV